MNRIERAAPSAAWAFALGWLWLASTGLHAQQPGIPIQGPEPPTATPNPNLNTSPFGGPGMMGGPGMFGGGLFPGLFGQRVGGVEQAWSTPTLPGFAGFPVAPNQLRGFGGYPVGSDPGDSLFRALLLAPAADEPPGWPAWVRTRSRAPLPFAPEVALLWRDSDRVWFRDGQEEPFVPLFFHDKLRALRDGAEVQVRRSGEFQLLLHDSARLVVSGATRLAVVSLTETDIALDFAALTRVDLVVRGRNVRLGLPDGSQLFLDAPSEQDQVVVPGRVQLRRADEPGWLGGRAYLTNLGERPVRWRHAFGEEQLQRNERVTFFVTPPRSPVPAALRSDGANVERQPASVTCRSDSGGWVSWSGARFELAPGAQLTLDPLLGAPFAEPPPPAQTPTAR